MWESEHFLYWRWYEMHRRCKDVSRRDFKNYGARGIRVDPRWNKFKQFREDMEPSFKPGLTLGRKDNDGPYCKENCRWETPQQQHRNTRQNRVLEINGLKKTVVEWSELAGISQTLVAHRLWSGWSDKDAVFRPIR
jgi:hypothetical protein